MLVSATEMLKKAKAGHYAVGQFNINDLEWTKAVLTAAEELRSPVILGVSEGAGKYMAGYRTVVGMVNGMIKEMDISVPVALHLDHGSYEGCLKCIDAGFSSVMFDGSHYPIEENIEKTTELVKLCHGKGLSIEAEVGSIGGEEDGVVGMGECADPKECKMIADLGVDFLAAGIGNIHGKYPANWKGLSFETLDAIQKLEKKDIHVKVSDISDVMNLPRPGVTRTVKEMEKKGYLSKIASPDDGRVTYISITEEGWKLFCKYDEKYFGELSADLSDISEEDADCMIRTIEKFYQIMCERRNHYDK